MNYYYEALNDLTFQKLAQALIVSVHPETVCLPVRQPDGGRDAFLYNAAMGRTNFVVFQVKFSTKPQDTTEREAIDKLISSEKEKVEALIKKGATHYYFVTNVQGTGHLDSGSIDRVNKILTEAFSIPSFVWWRDDLDARLDNAGDIKWSYPEICRATDVLQILVKRPENAADLEATRAITAYMGKQHGEDRDVKFKQVELKRRITDLFVDIPIGHKALHRSRNRTQGATRELREVEQYLDQLGDDFDYGDDDAHPFEHGGLAAGFLLHMPFGSGVSRFVLEGAPGQGKSTVTQFLCQVNRLKLLPPRRPDLGSVGEVHSSAPTRAPFRIDLRDFAAWVAGRHPFENAGEFPDLAEGQRSLESFLTLQISWHSGGLKLTEADLLDFFVRAHSVIVLDGFDEVADIPTRERVVEEICAAADRLDVNALSLQMIVTSRPAAFVNSPGFPEDDWVHLELTDLKRPNITNYKEKWAEAQELTTVERDALTATLEEKLTQPHLRDLSRNPMQLAILLQLMHVQGDALPDKRTALYEEYMKIFLNREVEKKQIAGNHRELILSIHGLLAWLLQIQAETGQGSGSISMDALKTAVTNYLEMKEHDLSVADSLLKGTVERVGALVSRVQGTFEFEVQPLREYFAARHLYKTAAYSPPGNERKGTRPDRFAALASSFYWTNVTRFFCGFYDEGELPSLVDGLIGIGEEPGYGLITQPRRLAMMLLADYVFTQSPSSMRRLVNFIVKEPDFQRLTGSDSMQGQRHLELPETAGGKILFEACASRLPSESDPAVCSSLRQVMSRNADPETLKQFWRDERLKDTVGTDPLAEARDFDLLDEFGATEIAHWTGTDTDKKLHWFAEANRHDDIVSDPLLYEAALQAFFNCDIIFFYRGPFRSTSVNKLVMLSELLHPHVLSGYFTIPPEQLAGLGRRAFRRHDIAKHTTIEDKENDADPLTDFLHLVVKLLDEPPETWQVDLSPWDNLTSRGFEMAPGGRLFSLIALMSTAVSAGWAQGGNKGDAGSTEQRQRDLSVDRSQGCWEGDGFAPTPGLVRRLYFSRSRAGDCGWWRDRLIESGGETRINLLAALACWGEPSVLRELRYELGDALEELDPQSWSWFWNLITIAQVANSSQVGKLDSSWFLENDTCHERLAITMTKRLGEDADRRLVVRHCFYGYEGGDWRILQMATEGEVFSEPQSGIDWEFAKRLSVKARAHGVSHLLSRSHSSQQVEVPSDVAEAVLTECDRHHSQFVSMCEQSFTSVVAQRAKTVSSVAENDKWFAPEARDA